VPQYPQCGTKHKKNLTHHGAAHGNCQDARALGPLRFWAAEHSDGRMVYGVCDVVVSILEYFGIFWGFDSSGFFDLCCFLIGLLIHLGQLCNSL